MTRTSKRAPYVLKSSFALLLVVSLLLVPRATTAQEIVQSSTVVSTADSSIAKLDQYIEQARIDWGVPGLSVAVVRADEVLLSKGYGVREVDASAPVDSETLFAIASNSKAFTAAALAILVDEGKLSWDDHVSDYLPWLKLSDPLATSDLRIRDLLCHRSGLGTFSGDLLWWGTDYSPREVLERAAILKPTGPFRAQYGYSNLMFLAAGEVIEQVSGETWDAFVEKKILQPLKMSRTVCSVRDLPSRSNYATPHKTQQNGSMPLPWMNWDTMAAAGGLISSADDMASWLQCQMRAGKLPSGDAVFSEKQSHEMWTAHMPIPVSEGYRQRFPTTHFRAYGLGWSMADYQGHKLVGHGGGYDGMYSQVAMIPEQRIGVVVLTNSMTSIGSAITYRALDTLLGAPERDWSADGLESFRKSRQDFNDAIQKVTTPVAENTHPSHSLDAYCGTFRCPMYGDAEVERQGEKLVLKLLPNVELVAELEHLHYDTFVLRWKKEFAWFGDGTANFLTDSRGIVRRIELDVPNDDLWFYELDLQRVVDEHVVDEATSP